MIVRMKANDELTLLKPENLEKPLEKQNPKKKFNISQRQLALVWSQIGKC